MFVAVAHPAMSAAASESRAIAPTPKVSDVERQAEALVREGQFLAAARLLAEELAGLPERFENRPRRNSLAIRTVNAYRLAFHADAERCDAAAEAVALADRYLSELAAVYGAVVQGADEYVGMLEVREELDRSRAERGCARAASPAATSARFPSGPLRDEAPPRPRAPREAPGNRPLIAGLALAGGMTGALLAVSLGTGLARVRDPFTGAAYDRIYDAARASHTDAIAGNEVGHDAGTDMCAAGREVGNEEVIAACGAWDSLGKVALATGVGTGVLAVTTAALAAVLVRRENRARASAALHLRRPIVGVVPGGRGGVRMLLQWRF